MLRSHFMKKEDSDRLLGVFGRLGLHPLIWSFLSVPLAAAGLMSLAVGNLAFGLGLFLLAGAIDMIDGAVARATNTSTLAGAYIDGVLDRYVELFLIMGLMLYLGEGRILGLDLAVWFMLLIFGSLMTSFVRAYADHRGLVKDPVELNRMGGLLERAERLMLLYLGMALGIYSRDWLELAIVAASILSNATAAQRILFAIKHAEHV